MGVDRRLDLARLGHHGLVEGGPAGGVEQHHVVAAEPASLDRAPGDTDRRLAGHDGQRRDVDLAPEHRKLLHRRRTAGIERCHQHLPPHVIMQAPGDLGGGGGLAGTLEADQHDRYRRRRIEIDRVGRHAERFDQLIVNDLHHHLARRHRLDDLDPDGALAQFLDEGARHLERHVSLEQRPPHLPRRRIDIGRGERTAPRQAIEDAG